MTYPEAKRAAEELRKTKTVPPQRYHAGETVHGLLILEATFNQSAWMWSYLVTAVGSSEVAEKMEWAL